LTLPRVCDTFRYKEVSVLPTETLKHQLAFELYILKGARASDSIMEYIAEKVGITRPRTIWAWYKKFNWRQRAEERIKERGDELKETTAHALRQIEDVAAEIIEEMVMQFKEKAENGEIKIERVSDLESLMRTFMTITGRMPRGETTINVITAIPRPEAESEAAAGQDPGFWKKVERSALPEPKTEN
jgi:hypothetical protein